MGNSPWLTRGAWPLMTALTALSMSAICLPATAQASTHPSRSASSGPGGSGSGTSPGLATEWWLNSLSAQQEWSAAPQEGTGVTVAVLSTGVDPGQQDLSGNVVPGPDFTGSGRSQGGQYWGNEGTAVASLIAGHGHGDGTQGISGIAPKARILSVRVTLDPGDPLLGRASTVQRLPDAIARGITYAVGHGAQVIDLPADPATLSAGQAGAHRGSAAEQAAVRHAIARGVVLVSPAGDTGTARDTSYPAAYPGVVAAGATDRNGKLSSFSSTGPYVSLTAPGQGVTVAKPGSGYTTLSSTAASAALTAGIAALVRSRYPQLSGSQVSQALKSGSAPVAGQVAGTGSGAVNAANAVTSAASAVSLIGTPTPKLVSRLPAETAIGVGAIIVIGLAIAGIMRLRRRRPDDDIPDWGDGLSARAPGNGDPGNRDDPMAAQRGPGSPGRRASAADAVGRAATAWPPRNTDPIPGPQNWPRSESAPFPGMPSQGSNPISGPMQAADSPLPRRQSRKRTAHHGAHRR